MKRTLTSQIQEVERELALRRKVYPWQVSTGKMRQAEADEHMLRMRCVLESLRELDTINKALERGKS